MATCRRSDAGRRALLAGLTGIVAIATVPAGGQVAPVWGQLHASSHHPVPGDATITPRALDDHPENRRLLRGLADALRLSGRAYRARGGALTLNFETEIERVPQTLQRGVRDTRGRVKFAIVMTLDEETSGRRLWSGEASYLGAANDESAIFDQILRVLADEIGRTTKLRGFDLD
jgi:hypothetical protein